VHIDIAQALGEGSMTAFIMLYLSIAFDVIDHPILLKCLEFSFGISVSVADKTSPDIGLHSGVPWGIKELPYV